MARVTKIASRSTVVHRDVGQNGEVAAGGGVGSADAVKHDASTGGDHGERVAPVPSGAELARVQQQPRLWQAASKSHKLPKVPKNPSDAEIVDFLHSAATAVPPNIASFVLAQLIVVALPEEAFFRGYVQTGLTDLAKRRVRMLGAELAPGAWILQGVLFALLHFIVDPHPSRLAVFFPGLLFGWVRAWRGGIGAAMALHAMSNLYSEILARSWL